MVTAEMDAVTGRTFVLFGHSVAEKGGPVPMSRSIFLNASPQTHTLGNLSSLY